MKRILAAALSLILFIPLMFSSVSASETYNTYTIAGINIDRKSNYLVVYTSEHGATTGTEGAGFEASVGADGKVISVSESSDTAIPEGGFVLSGSGARKTIVSSLTAGDMVSYDADTMKILILGKDYSPFTSTVFTYTRRNGARAENTLIIYDTGETTGTNTWGYEVCVNSDNNIVSVGGNNNEIPEGGYVLSVIGTQKQALIDAAQLGMTVEIDDTARTVTVSYTKENALSSYKLKKQVIEDSVSSSKAAFALIDYDKLDRIIARMDEVCAAVEKALEDDNMLSFLNNTEYFDEIYAIAQNELIEYIPVEGRVIWLRIPTNSSDSVVQSTVKQIYDSGYNTVCIEALFDSTTIMPMPADSLFEQNPVFESKDMLKVYIDEFHKYGIEVDLWMSCYRVGYQGSTNTSRSVGYKKNEWCNVSSEGDILVSNEYGDAYFLNPALPEVRQFLLDIYEYILKNYDIDGFQLDYVRYPEASTQVFGYDDYTKKAFNEKYGEGEIPTSSSQGRWAQWCEFRASFVTELVKSVGELIDRIRPDVLFSCDVAPQYSESKTKMCQDSLTWMKEGLVDAIYPMAYGTTDAVTKWTGITLEACGDSVFAFIGLRDNGAEVYRDQIVAVRKAGGDGSAFFSYSQYIAGDYPGVIDKTVYSKTAVSPSYNAKTAVKTLLENTAKKLETLAIPAMRENNYSSLADQAQKLLDEIKAYCEKLSGSTISECSAEFETLCNNADLFVSTLQFSSATYKAGDPYVSTVGLVESDFALAAKAAKLSRDDARSEYQKDHPLPELYELTEKETEPDEFDEVSAVSSEDTVSENTKKETTVGEKIVQVIFIIVMTTGVIGLPLYFWLNKRKKAIAAEYDGSDKKDRPDEEDDDSTVLPPDEGGEGDENKPSDEHKQD